MKKIKYFIMAYPLLIIYFICHIYLFFSFYYKESLNELASGFLIDIDADVMDIYSDFTIINDKKINKIDTYTSVIIKLNQILRINEEKYLYKKSSNGNRSNDIKILNNLFKGRNFRLSYSTKIKKFNLKIGDRIIIKAKINGESIINNPGAIDFDFINLSKGIYGTLSLRDLKIYDNSLNWGSYFILIGKKLKNFVVSNHSLYLDEEEKAISLAMIFGIDDYLSYDLKEQFKILGLAHILVASGSNVNLIILFLFFIDKKSKSKKIMFLLYTVLLIAYASLSNFDPSISRAVIFFLIHFLSVKILKYQIHPAQSTALSGLILLYWKPYYALNIGFMMSNILALYLLSVSYPWIRGKDIFSEVLFIKSKSLKLSSYLLIKFYYLATSVINTSFVFIFIQFLLLPFFYVFNSKISPYALIFNIFLLPILFGIPFLGIIANLLSAFNLKFFNFATFLLFKLISMSTKILLKISSFDFIQDGNLIFYKNYIFIFPIFLSIYILWQVYGKDLIKNKKSQLILNFSVLLSMSLNFICQYNQAYWEITFLDVKQGDSCLLIDRQNNITYLIDTGLENNYSVINNALNFYSINTIDYCIISHEHLDHMGSLPLLLKNNKIKNLVIADGTGKYHHKSQSFDIRAISRMYNINLYEAGKDKRLNNFKFLAPEHLIIPGDENKNSLVLYAEMFNKKEPYRFLFTGDIGFEEEEKLMIHYSDILEKINVLKIAHHGSKYSSSNMFLHLVKPDLAFIPVGRNFYGHPSPEVLYLLNKNNVRYFRADENYALSIVITKDKFYFTQYSSYNKKSFFQKLKWEKLAAEQ